MRNNLFLILYLLFVPIISLAQTKNPPIVKWVYMADAEPINWLENGVAKGIEVEIVERVLKRLGIKVIHEFYPWQRAQKMIKTGQADGIMTTPTSERFTYCVFGKENTLPNYWNLFVRKDNSKIINEIPNLKTLEDLKKYKLIDFIGNGWTTAFMKDGYNIEKVPRIEQIPLILSKGRGDLAINSSSWINWWATKQGIDHNLKEFDIEWNRTRFHFVFMISRKSKWIDLGLIRAMDNEVKKMKESGEWLKLLKKYKNPHGFGKPFKSHLDEFYEKKHGFYTNYSTYPIYTK